jgi:hypothetical protein
MTPRDPARMKHANAVQMFWTAFYTKAPDTTVQDMRSAVNYILGKLPTWAVNKATGWIKEWQR